MGKTTIEWTATYRDDGTVEPGHTINPIRARLGEHVGHFCRKTSPGCGNCYSSRFQRRVGLPEFKGESDELGDRELFLDESKLQEVLRRKKATRYFWCDMTDLFGSWVPDEWIDRCFATMALTPQHTHQVLTKRAERARDYILSRTERGLPAPGVCQYGGGDSWKHNNVLFGFSAESQEWFDHRWKHFFDLAEMGYRLFLSAEPLLGPLSLPDDFLGPFGTLPRPWVIVGGESGPGARPMHPDWARSLRDQCQAAHVPFFFKQWGCWVQVYDRDTDPDARNLPDMKNGRRRWLNLAGGSGFHGDRVIAVENVRKDVAGRLLDGKEWSQFPEVRP